LKSEVGRPNEKLLTVIGGLEIYFTAIALAITQLLPLAQKNKDEEKKDEKKKKKKKKKPHPLAHPRTERERERERERV
jgi:hypothetical protein